MQNQMFPRTEGERLRRVQQWLTAELEKAEKASDSAAQKVVECRGRLEDCEQAIKRLDEFGDSYVDAEAVIEDEPEAPQEHDEIGPAVDPATGEVL